MKNKRPAMGRGLSALLDISENEPANSGVVVNKISPVNFAMLPLEQISANPFQPRTVFEEQALLELVESVIKQGIIQPVTVRKVGDDKFQLISGGRRFKAAKMAELHEIPAYIRVADDIQVLEMALVENIQRENLDPIEIAVSFQRLIEECNLTHDALSANVGKNRSTITNYLRLLKLPAEIQIALRNSKITMGHARALINIIDAKVQLKLFNEILKHDLSVRNVENMVRNIDRIKPEKSKPKSDNRYNDISRILSNALNAKISLKRNKEGNGSIIIRFSSDQELNRIINLLNIK
jgi:ParB family chromosome partitioning protein